MIFQNNPAFVFLIFLPLIVLFYLMKQKAKDYRVSGLQLWQETYRNQRADTPWEKLKHNIIMYLQLLLMTLFILALAMPLLIGKQEGTKHAVLVIDNSAGMGAIYTEDKTRLEVAKEAAIEYVEGCQKDTKFTVITASKDGEVLLSNALDKKKIKEILYNIEETQLPGDTNAAKELCQSMVAQWEDYSILLYTDSAAAYDTMNYQLVDCSSQGENCSIDSVSHSLNAETGLLTILVRLTNHGETATTREIGIYLEDVLEDITTVELAAGEEKSFYFQNIVSPTSEEFQIRVALTERDALEQDNTAWDIVAPAMTGNVLLVTEKNAFLEQALLANDKINLYKTSDLATVGEGEFDLYVFDGRMPEQLPEEGNLLFIAPTMETESPYFKVKEEKRGVYLFCEEHDITSYIEEYQFGVNQVALLETPSWAKSFLKTEGGYSAGYIGITGGRTVAVLAFDLHQSDFPLQTEFPILMYQLLENCLENQLVSERNLTAGDEVRIHSKWVESTPELTMPNGTKEQLANGTTEILYENTAKCGVYHIYQEDSTKKNSAEELFAVNYPTNMESNVTLLEINEYSDTTDTISSNVGMTTVENAKNGRQLRNYLLFVGIALLVALWFVERRLGDHRLYATRFVLFVLIALAIANISVPARENVTSTVFLVDLSDSMQGKQEEAAAFICDAVKDKKASDSVAVVAFGADARVEQFLTEEVSFDNFGTLPVSTATNIEQALRTAQSIYPEESAKRLVLLTDGAENQGNMQEMVSALQAGQVKVQVLSMEQSATEEVYVSNLTLPKKVNVGDDYLVTVEIESNVQTRAQVHLYSDEVRKLTQEVQLQAGTNQYVFHDTRTEGGLVSYRVVIEPEADTRSVNNDYSAFTYAEAQPKVLLIEGKENEGTEFAKILAAAGADYSRISAGGAPKTVIAMNKYEAIILLNVSAEDLPSGFMDNIEAYVADYAGGLVAIGGDQSFALGNYRDTSLEEVLPVYMDLQGEKEIPAMAMVTVIDKSGSMTGTGAEDKLLLAKRAAAGAVNNLRPIDSFGVIAFDDGYEWVVPLAQMEDAEAVKTAISTIQGGGGTSIYPAIATAVEELKNSSAKLKHIILLTDGQDGYRRYDALVEAMNELGITLSTVAVGSDADARLLSALAENANGRYYFARRGNELPTIFAQEVYLSLGNYLVNREFTPEIVNTSEILNGVAENGMPSLLGYVASTKKELATEYLTSDEADPILTSWQYGIGRTVAWNSDGTNEWTANYAGKEEYARLWRNILDWTGTQIGEGEDQLETDSTGEGVTVTYHTKEYSADTQIEVVYTNEKGESKHATLTAEAPGTYSTQLPMEETGVYSLYVTKKEGEKILEGSSSGIAKQYSKEYQFAENTQALSDFVRNSGGNFITEAKEVFLHQPEKVQTEKSLSTLFLILLILFFLLDIAEHRFGFSYRRWIEHWLGVGHSKWLTQREELQARAARHQVQQQKEQEDKTEQQRQTQKIEETPKKKQAQKPREPVQRLDTGTLLSKKKERKR